MFCRSKTLQEVDQLIRASDSDYTHLDVTFLEVRLLVTEKMRDNLATLGKELDLNEGYKVFEEVLLLKKLDVILALQCTIKNAKSPIVKNLCRFTPRTPRPSIIRLQGHKSLVFRGFHPSTYLRDDYTTNLNQSEIDRLRRGCTSAFDLHFSHSKAMELDVFHHCREART
jgi:hypothetical protein